MSDRFLRLSLALSLLCFGDDGHADVLTHTASADNRSVGVVKLDSSVSLVQQMGEQFLPDDETQSAPVIVEVGENADQYTVGPNCQYPLQTHH